MILKKMFHRGKKGIEPSQAASHELKLGQKTYLVRSDVPNRFAISTQHESWLDDVYAGALSLGEGAFIDVGANVGQTLIKILAIDEMRQYVGFDPQVAASYFIEQFILDNQLANHSILSMALSDCFGVAKLYVREDGDGVLTSSSASIVDGFRPAEFYSGYRRIYTVPGDDVVAQLDIDRIAMIKIDVEGAELEVLRGLPRCLDEHHPFILFEVLHHYLAITKEALDKDTIEYREKRLKELEEILRRNDYCIFKICGTSAIERVDVIEPEYSGDLTTTDYIAVPSEKEADFRLVMGRTRHVL